MTGKPWPTLAHALLLVAAFVASLFFNGYRIEYFSLSLFLLLALLAFVLWRGYAGGWRVPLTATALALTAFWGWLALTLLWSDVPYVSSVNFWWVGSACFVFWLVTLGDEPERIWRWISVPVLATGVVLAVVALYQMIVLKESPRSTFLTHNSHAALLILMAVPAAAHYLRAPARADATGEWRWQPRLLEIVLFVFMLAVAITGSRGVALGMVAGIGLLVALAWRHVPRKRVFALLGIIVAAYIVADLLKGGLVMERLGSIVRPASAGYDRLLIWERAWAMLRDAPWWGIGLGTYWLYWPPYRHPEDTSAGFYVHNDYLQIWIETGLPGLLLLLCIYAAVATALVRLLRRAGVGTGVRIESAGLFGGLLSIAVHAFVDFDLYIHPIQLMLGAILARLHALYAAHTPVQMTTLQPARWLGRLPYRLIVLAVVLPLMLYAVALGVSAWLAERGRELGARQQWVEASATLTRAAQWMPVADLTLTLHADLLRRALPQLPPEAREERRTLYREAFGLLARAERANPLRPQIFFTRGLLMQHNPEFAGADWAARAQEAYAQALRRDPRAYWARTALAALLWQQGRPAQAREVLEAGANYFYPDRFVVEYYFFVARARRQAGDIAGAEAMAQKIERLTGRPPPQPASPLDLPAPRIAR